ncbi:hypothetical protein L0Y65_02385 [Candidatus Micrarchaeota archaeon]|nr:hypothetical protein [Candidatus Micrarchaeota archaeon]
MRLLFLLFIVGMANAQYAEPPLANVVANNTAAAAALEGYYNSSFAQNATITLRFHDYAQSPNISASIILAGLSPSIDNVSCITNDTALVAARGYSAGPLVSIPYEGLYDFSCDKAWHDSIPPPSMPLRCDFDGDDCSEFVNRTIVIYNLNATFAFRNESASVPFESTLISVPPQLLPLLENASGSENLTVNVSGNVTFIYEVNDQIVDGLSCYANYTNFTSSINISASRSFTVGGKQKLFFLVAPVLREQWFRNNRFDVVAFSQCPLYFAEIGKNGAGAKNMTIRTFNTTTDGFGFMGMVSNLSIPDGWSEDSAETVAPSGLETFNNSFAFVYRFNFSYSGLGESNLSLAVRDSVLSSAQYNETLLSRMLTHSGTTTETGQNASLVPSRPSAGFEPGMLSRLEISLGLVGVVLILAFLNFWIAR